jgi:undecaprenyl-phosphate galactose phosphotransferase
MRVKKTPLLMMVTDMLALVLAFLGGYVLSDWYSALILGREFPPFAGPGVNAWVTLYTVQALTMLVLLSSKGHYTQRSPWWEQMKYVLLLSISMMVLAGYVLYAFKMPLSRLWVGFSFALMVPLFMILRQMARRVALMLGQWGTDVTIMGGPENVLETIFALNSDTYNLYRIKEIYLVGTNATLDVATLPPSQQGAKQALARSDQYAMVIKAATGKLMIAAPDESTRMDLAAFMQTAEAHGKQAAFIPPMGGMSLYGMDVQHFFGSHTVLIKPKRRVEKPLNRFFKRVLDLVGASIGLLILGLPILIITRMIRKDGGKAFYAQKRVGRDGKPFNCWKLRSMVPDADAVLKELLERDPDARAEYEADFKLKNDPRITKIGHVIRKTSIDELPQLWNVIKGEMSLVGPRPIVTKELEYYGKHQHDYLATKPGLTGLWQVSGRNDTSYAYRVYLDSWYVAHWSLWTDIVIIVQTVVILLNRKGAY